MATAALFWLIFFALSPQILFAGPIKSLSSSENKKGTSLSCELRNLYLNEHNKYRNKVAGGEVSGLSPAADMMELVWDDKLAASAQELVKTGLSYGLKANEYNFFPLNDLWIWKCWKRKFIRRGIKYMFYRGLHYTSPNSSNIVQLTWAKLRTVGCGYARSYEEDHTHCTLYCVYGPRLGYEESPYTKGNRDCEKIGAFNSTKFNYLCAPSQNTTNVC